MEQLDPSNNVLTYIILYYVFPETC